MADTGILRVAAVQASPIFLDRDASLEKAVNLIKQAADEGAVLAAFGEAWLPGYPIHAWASSASPLWWEFASAYLDQSIEILMHDSDEDIRAEAALALYEAARSTPKESRVTAAFKSVADSDVSDYVRDAALKYLKKLDPSLE